MGGQEVKPIFKYPWLAAVYIDGNFACGGTIIDRTTFLTAAHCSQFPTDKLEVSIHRHDLTKKPEQERGATVRVNRVTVHPGFNNETIDNDIAVWKIEVPSPIKISHIELDDGSLGLREGELVKAAGWGKTWVLGQPSPILLEVSLPLSRTSTCSFLWGLIGKGIKTETQICAGQRLGRNACHGDSGGPLFITRDGQDYLLGVTSFGLPCAHWRVPTIWTRVAGYRDFITEAQNESADAPPPSNTDSNSGPVDTSSIDKIRFSLEADKLYQEKIVNRNQ